MLVSLVVVVVVSHQLPSSFHQKCPMYLHMQLHERPNQINPANFIYMRPFIIGIAYLFLFKFCLSSKWDPLQAATKFLERHYALFGRGSNNNNSTMSIATFWRLF